MPATAGDTACLVPLRSATCGGMNVTRITIAAIAIASSPLAAQAETAHAPTAHAPSGNRDVRCLMLSNLFTKTSPVEQAKVAASQARLFYLGRVSSKFTSAQLETAMNAEAKAIDSDHAGPDMNACLASVQAAAAAAEVAGKKAAATASGPVVKP
jgi:hypothetical protein